MKLSMILVSSFVLFGCAQEQNKTVSFGNDGLPSAEVIAFQEVDKRLGYRNARIEFDAKDCVLCLSL